MYTRRFDHHHFQNLYCIQPLKFEEDSVPSGPVRLVRDLRHIQTICDQGAEHTAALKKILQERTTYSILISSRHEAPNSVKRELRPEILGWWTFISPGTPSMMLAVYLAASLNFTYSVLYSDS
ncbi:hypothetical protein BDV12DRAFT_166854 [Aspergillus spectabilis]